MLKPIGLIEGHYECRSLDETLPVFTDLLAMEIIERKANQATIKHPNTDWRLVVHESGAAAPEKTFDNHYGFRVASHTEVEAAWEYIEANKQSIASTRSPSHRKPTSPTRSTSTSPAAIIWKLNITIPAARCTAAPTPRDIGRHRSPRSVSRPRLRAPSFNPWHAAMRRSGEARRFIIGVLGLEQAGGMSDRTVYVKHPATPWYVVMLPRKPRQYLAPVNRFTLQLATAAEVEAAHHEFVSNKSPLGLNEIGALETRRW